MSELSGITYKWNINDFEFTLFISEVKTRYNDEGVVQLVHLDVNNFRLKDGFWGIGKFLTDIKKDDSFFFIEDDDEKCVLISNKLYFKIDDFSDYIIISGDEYIEFNKWLMSCISPKNQGRINKINKIKKRICCTQNM